MHRLREGYCQVPNPFNPNQVSRISLALDDVDVIVFWTRNAAPLIQHLPEFDALGFRYCFLYTMLDNPPMLDPGMATLDERLATVQALADAIGPARIAWRYDPIVLTAHTPPAFHVDAFGRIASELRGCTDRAIISFVDLYRKLTRRLRALEEAGYGIREPGEDDLAAMLPAMAQMAHENGMEIQSCAEELDLTPFGVSPGKCIDEDFIQRACNITVAPEKDPSQRPACGCVASRDVGCYDTCLHGCAYCYATGSPKRVRANYDAHDPKSPRIV